MIFILLFYKYLSHLCKKQSESITGHSGSTTKKPPAVCPAAGGFSALSLFLYSSVLSHDIFPPHLNVAHRLFIPGEKIQNPLEGLAHIRSMSSRPESACTGTRPDIYNTWALSSFNYALKWILLLNIHWSESCFRFCPIYTWFTHSPTV